jgi:hypothetical protein
MVPREEFLQFSLFAAQAEQRRRSTRLSSRAMLDGHLVRVVALGMEMRGQAREV